MYVTKLEIIWELEENLILVEVPIASDLTLETTLNLIMFKKPKLDFG